MLPIHAIASVRAICGSHFTKSAIDIGPCVINLPANGITILCFAVVPGGPMYMHLDVFAHLVGMG